MPSTRACFARCRGSTSVSCSRWRSSGSGRVARIGSGCRCSTRSCYCCCCRSPPSSCWRDTATPRCRWRCSLPPAASRLSRSSGGRAAREARFLAQGRPRFTARRRGRPLRSPLASGDLSRHDAVQRRSWLPEDRQGRQRRFPGCSRRCSGRRTMRPRILRWATPTPAPASSSSPSTPCGTRCA